VRIWARETEEFGPEIVGDALRKLMRNNPRNPFRPSVQDIIAAAQSVLAQWSEHIERSYLPEASNLSSRYLLPRRLPEVGEPPASWSARVTIDVLRPRLEEMASRYSSAITEGASSARPSAITAAEYIGGRLAKDIGPRLAQWADDLLAEFGVLTGLAFAKVQRLANAEEEERRQTELRKRQEQQHREAEAQAFRQRQECLNREARNAAMARPEVKAAMDASQATRRRTYDHAHKTFLAVWQLVLREEMAARGLMPPLQGDRS
jgi:hypothetical protein